MPRLTITRPDDWHLHLRDGDLLTQTVPASAQHFARALIMPNLKPALTTLSAIAAYRQRILQAIPENNAFTPYMTLYLNASVSPDAIQAAAQCAYLLGAKLYPAGATTHSDQGVTSLKALYPLLDVMQQEDLVLQIHGEVTHGDVFAREALFIEEHLKPLLHDFRKLRIVLEHISSQTAVDFVTQAPATLAATITPHHLLYDRNALLAQGIRPHFYCLPILKTRKDQLALQQAACSGNPKFFAGTDSAPHAIETKETACGCAGIYSAPFAVSLYAQVFDAVDKLPKLDHFLSHFGATFYQLPVTEQRLELVKTNQTIPLTLPFGKSNVVPIAAGDTVAWSVHASS